LPLRARLLLSQLGHLSSMFITMSHGSFFALAAATHHTFCNTTGNYTGESFWARGYYVSTVGRDEEAIRRYISKQEAEDNQLEQREIFSDR